MRFAIRALLVAIVLSCALAGSAQQSDVTNEKVLPPATVTGSGTVNFIPMWTGTSTLGNSKIFQTGGKIGINTQSPNVQLDVNGRINTANAYRIGNVDVLRIPSWDPTALSVGPHALASALNEATGDTAIGFDAIESDQSDGGNTALGTSTLKATSGDTNTAVGTRALTANTTGFASVGVGFQALESNTTGGNNIAVGSFALVFNLTGHDDIGIGRDALFNTTSGDSNIAIGTTAGQNLLPAASNNIMVSNLGQASDSGTIRLGTSGTQTSFFVAGVRGTITGLSDAVPVVIDSNGQMGTISSSRRFKEDIQDMGEASRGLMKLRPVTFRYQKPFADGSKPLQYGLVAEEVAKSFPDLVAHSADGQVETVKYQLLDSMLLNELQRQQNEIAELKESLARMETLLHSLDTK